MAGVDPMNPMQPAPQQADKLRGIVSGEPMPDWPFPPPPYDQPKIVSIAGIGRLRAAAPAATMRALREKIPMSDDDSDFIERAESLTEKLYGKPATIDQIAEKFTLYGVKKRAAALEDFDAELRGEIGSGSHSLRRRVQLMALRRKMGGVHQALRKARR